MYKSIIFWQNSLSPHQSETISELAEQYQVTWCVDEFTSCARLKQGWARPQLRSAVVKKMLSSDAVVTFLASLDARESIHILSPVGAKCGELALCYIKKHKLRYAFLMERPSGKGFRLRLNHLRYRWFAHKYSDVEFVLAMGDIGTRCYRSLGFKKVKTFGYTVSHARLGEQPEEPKSKYRFIVVAQLIERKRIDLLLRALAQLQGDWECEVIGRGGLKLALKSLAESFHLSDRIIWYQTLPNMQVQQKIRSADTLILASDDEGWGAVVNEAIGMGTRVIVSDACGAASLCELPEAGEVFRSGACKQLEGLLFEHYSRGEVTWSERQRRAALTHRFDGKALAHFLDQVINGGKDDSPYRKEGQYEE